MPSFDGLNLTWETLEGIVKHNGPLTDAAGKPIGNYASAACRRRSPTTTPRTTSSSGAMPSAEAQVAAIADDIAYDAHDIDDGLRAGLFALDDLAGLPLVGEHAARGARRSYPGHRCRRGWCTSWCAA